MTGPPGRACKFVATLSNQVFNEGGYFFYSRISAACAPPSMVSHTWQTAPLCNNHTEHVFSELILVKLTKTKVTVRLRTTIWDRFVQNVLRSWPI